MVRNLECLTPCKSPDSWLLSSLVAGFLLTPCSQLLLQASAIEIERVCNTAHERILETAALALSPQGGGPEQLVIMVVFKEGPVPSIDTCRKAFSLAIQKKLNPLFKVSAVEVVSEFPRTASNKLLRRVLRAKVAQKQKAMSKL
jgi:acyl-coenzyme A synthetase/AMP-(fatty) acid ligase